MPIVLVLLLLAACSATGGDGATRNEPGAQVGRAETLTQDQWNEVINPMAHPNETRASPAPRDNLIERIERDDLERRVRALENERLDRQR